MNTIASAESEVVPGTLLHRRKTTMTILFLDCQTNYIKLKDASRIALILISNL